LDFQKSSERDDVPVFKTPTRRSISEQQRHTTPVPKTPTRSTSGQQLPGTSALLPPIELQPPSPPRLPPFKKEHVQRRSRAYTTSNENQVVESSSSVKSGAPPPPLSPNNNSKLLLLSPSSSSTSSPGKSSIHQSVSLGRSTGVNVGVGDETVGGSGGMGRRNSLGDLKIPVRISQAQVGLRRDLGMVREFANNVER
jgi:hypothetical protein